MGTSSAKTIRASRHVSLHNRPDIRLQPCLLNPHTHEFLQSGRRPYKTIPRWKSTALRRSASEIHECIPPENRLGADSGFISACSAESGNRPTENVVADVRKLGASGRIGKNSMYCCP